MQVGTIQKLISIFDQSFKVLGVGVSLEKLEELSVTIHRAMTVHTRHFHTLEHVFNFYNPNNPILSLAGLYHDIVYHQVDMGFSPQVWNLVSTFIFQDGENYSIAGNVPETERMFHLTLDTFDLHPCQQLSLANGFNEFMSALVMNSQLAGLVREPDLALMIMCVEATIPFRGFSQDGKSHFDQQEERMPAIFRHYGLEISQPRLVEGIRTAVEFANKDIENFSEVDTGRFLDNTWKLLPETNAALRLPDVYSIGAYREALQKMAGFFENLSADVVFNRYRGTPPEDVYAQLVMTAGRNIQLARLYLGIKILGITIIEALARATGGDAPLSLFLGDIPRDGLTIKRLEYYLPELADPPWVDHNSTIYHLLENGRSQDTTFDMKNSPLSLFIYKSIPPERLAYDLQLARKFHSGGVSAEDFLGMLDPNLLRPIAQASSIMVYTRRQELLRFAREGQSQGQPGLL